MGTDGAENPIKKNLDVKVPSGQKRTPTLRMKHDLGESGPFLFTTGNGFHHEGTSAPPAPARGKSDAPPSGSPWNSQVRKYRASVHQSGLAMLTSEGRRAETREVGLKCH